VAERIELVVPEVGESITEVMVASWLVEPGAQVTADQPVAEIESDKATLELPAPADGVLAEVKVAAGEMAQVGDVIGFLSTDADAGDTAQPQPSSGRQETASKQESAPKPDAPAAPPTPAADAAVKISPAARRAADEAGVDITQLEGTGRGGLITKEDVAQAAEQDSGAPTPASKPADKAPAAAPSASSALTGAGEEDIVTMSPIRRTIARRLLESQQTTAQLTTFNEADMSAVIALRSEYKERFQEKYGIKLGFMSFFVKAAIEALKDWPAVNAEIRDGEIVYKNYYNIGIAVGGGKGLVVPVLRNAERMSFAEIELAIADFARRAADNKIALDELAGGTFTISNGGVYGSMLSTPILNPPQSGILGLHNIQERPVVRGGEVVARPLMYLALTYDHRMVDGRESVGFLIRVKEVIEDPARIFLEV
jgi:2-oxoglutarate dehydrogenase E2 component (dihydrolipoamide succinyltransferase)